MTVLWNGSLPVAQGRATVRDTAHDGALYLGATPPSGFTANGTAGGSAPQRAGA
ncbi:hypothetical protein SUDANB6_05200 [Streptomyces sp. enrichment culture]|uniref:hypothetical protein n=1 Tax=Streptomyces sp. enrichment culture TaxID=1795815 RepID=UPI003F564C7D